MKRLYRPFTVNLIDALVKAESFAFFLASETDDVWVPPDRADLSQLANSLAEIIGECKMDFLCEETRDGNIKTKPNRRTGFHKTENHPVVGHPSELRDSWGINSGREPDQQLDGPEEKGNDGNFDDSGFPTVT